MTGWQTKRESGICENTRQWDQEQIVKVIACDINKCNRRSIAIGGPTITRSTGTTRE